MTNTELQTTAAPQNSKCEPQTKGTGRVYAPRVDVMETDESLILFADLPGVKPDDVSLTCQGDELTLHARCTPRRVGGKILHAEYGVGDFYRTFTISEQVDANAMEASLANGVLTVRVPKAQAIRPKRIAVQGR